MKRKRPQSLWDIFGEIPDARDPLGKRFSLQSILAVAFCALSCGRNSVAAIARWGRSLTPSQLAKLGIYRAKAPCQATYHNALKTLEPSALVPRLGKVVRSYSGRKAALGFRHLALDGKVLRGSKHGEYPGILVMSAFLTELDGVIAQEKVPFKKGNEATHALKLLEQVSLKGRLVTGDAALTQRKICKKVIEGGGDFLLAVKDNQPGLKEQIALVFGAGIFPLGRSKKGTRHQGDSAGRKGPRPPRSQTT